jgi:hypothetical protein
MGIFGKIFGGKKDKIELDAEDVGPEERALLMSMVHNRKKQQLVEVE